MDGWVSVGFGVGVSVRACVCLCLCVSVSVCKHTTYMSDPHSVSAQRAGDALSESAPAGVRDNSAAAHVEPLLPAFAKRRALPLARRARDGEGVAVAQAA
jgi:hypothetical protein